MATREFIGFDPTTGDAFKFDSKMNRKNHNAVTAAEKALIRAALGVPASAEGLTPANNLSDVANLETSQANMQIMPLDDVYDLALSGGVSNAAVYDGARSRSYRAANALHSFTDGTRDLPLAFAADIKPIRFSGQGVNGFWIASKWGTTAADQEYRFWVNNSGFLRLELSDTSGNIVGLAYDVSAFAGKRFHVAATFNAKSALPNAHNDVQLFVNGINVTASAIQVTNASYAGMSVTASDFEVGGVDGVDYALGNIYSVVLYPRILRDDEVAELAQNRNQVDVYSSHGDRTNRAVNGSFDSFTGSTPDNWTVGANPVTSEETVIVQSGSALRFTAGGSQSSSTSNQIYQDGVIDSGDVLVEFDIYEVSAGTLTFGPGYLYAATYDGTTLTEAESQLRNTAGSYPDAQIYDSQLIDLGGGWKHVKVWFTVNAANTVGRLAIAGSGEWIMDNFHASRAGAFAAYYPSGLSRGVWRDDSLNGFDLTHDDEVALLFNPYGVNEDLAWTPGLTLGGGSTGMVLGTQLGRATRIREHFWSFKCRVQITTKGSSAGSAVITGLPKTAANEDAGAVWTAARLGNASLGGAISAMASVSNNTSDVNLYLWNSSGTVALDDTNLANGSIVEFSFEMETEEP